MFKKTNFGENVLLINFEKYCLTTKLFCIKKKITNSKRNFLAR